MRPVEVTHIQVSTPEIVAPSGLRTLCVMLELSGQAPTGSQSQPTHYVMPKATAQRLKEMLENALRSMEPPNSTDETRH